MAPRRTTRGKSKASSTLTDQDVKINLVVENFRVEKNLRIQDYRKQREVALVEDKKLSLAKLYQLPADVRQMKLYDYFEMMAFAPPASTSSESVPDSANGLGSSDDVPVLSSVDATIPPTATTGTADGCDPVVTNEKYQSILKKVQLLQDKGQQGRAGKKTRTKKNTASSQSSLSVPPSAPSSTRSARNAHKNDYTTPAGLHVAMSSATSIFTPKFNPHLPITPANGGTIMRTLKPNERILMSVNGSPVVVDNLNIANSRMPTVQETNEPRLVLQNGGKFLSPQLMQHIIL